MRNPNGTPSRIALKPLATSSAASSLPKPSASGVKGANFSTKFMPRSITTRPDGSVNHRPECCNVGSGRVCAAAVIAPMGVHPAATKIATSAAAAYRRRQVIGPSMPSRGPLPPDSGPPTSGGQPDVARVAPAARRGQAKRGLDDVGASTRACSPATRSSGDESGNGLGLAHHARGGKEIIGRVLADPDRRGPDRDEPVGGCGRIDVGRRVRRRG